MKRKTQETEIVVEMNGNGSIATGDRVLDHMLRTLFFYMKSTANIRATGDLRHHLWEDTGITVGMALREALPPQFERFGTAIMPMDDALVLVAVDISGRSYVSMELNLKEKEEGFQESLVHEFLWGLSRALRATIHVKQLSGVNAHHIIEAVFKALGSALSQAIRESSQLNSTKGVIE